jgi:hypothetical protein
LSSRVGTSGNYSQRVRIGRRSKPIWVVDATLPSLSTQTISMALPALRNFLIDVGEVKQTPFLFAAPDLDHIHSSISLRKPLVAQLQCEDLDYLLRGAKHTPKRVYMPMGLCESRTMYYQIGQGLPRCRTTCCPHGDFTISIII